MCCRYGKKKKRTLEALKRRKECFATTDKRTLLKQKSFFANAISEILPRKSWDPRLIHEHPGSNLIFSIIQKRNFSQGGHQKFGPCSVLRLFMCMFLLRGTVLFHSWAIFRLLRSLQLLRRPASRKLESLSKPTRLMSQILIRFSTSGQESLWRTSFTMAGKHQFV